MPDLFPDAPRSVSIDQQIACVERELGYRRHVYACRVADGKMTQAKADSEIAQMEAVLLTLRMVKR
jgi:hypothetical protein